MMRIENLNSLRVIILPAEVIGERYTVQRRTHRKYRTNKKWKKRYGVAVRYKDRIILDNISRVVYMTEKTYERMKKGVEVEKGYHPSVCGWSVPCFGTPLCRLQTMPCALLQNKKCYMQESDEAVEAIGKLLKEEGEKET